jgi:DNA-binding response OmpR family regulator
MKARILVLEDDPAIRRLVQLVLSDNGFDLSLVPDGPSAVEQARMNHPDVVLLDYMLPGDDGEVVGPRPKSGVWRCAYPAHECGRRSRSPG